MSVSFCCVEFLVCCAYLFEGSNCQWSSVEWSINVCLCLLNKQVIVVWEHLVSHFCNSFIGFSCVLCGYKSDFSCLPSDVAPLLFLSWLLVQHSLPLRVTLAFCNWCISFTYLFLSIIHFCLCYIYNLFIFNGSQPGDIKWGTYISMHSHLRIWRQDLILTTNISQPLVNTHTCVCILQ